MYKGTVTRFDVQHNMYEVTFDEDERELWSDQEVQRCAPPPESLPIGPCNSTTLEIAMLKLLATFL